MEKHHHRKFNRVLHPNRYFIWAIVLIVLAGSALSAYIYISSYNSTSPDFAQDQRRSFLDRADGFAAFYPASWQLEKDQGSTIFENPADISESIAVAPAPLSSEKTIRRALKIQSEYDYTTDGVSREILIAVKRDNSPDLSVAFVKNSAKLFYIYGHSRFLSNFVSAFQIIPPANQK